MSFLRSVTACCVLALGCHCVQAQSIMTLPEASQRATVSQRIGLTDITIVYHRPLVAGRKVWGGLVPYDQVWRAGANENTTIEFSTPVTVEGQALPQGTYGLHMIPGTDSWSVVFSKASTAWGSFTYDQKEDALRVTVKPQPSEMHEALTYDFDDVKPDSAALTLRWEKLAVPFHVGVDRNQATLASLRSELRGAKQYDWRGYFEAANYCYTNKIAFEDGLKWANQSIAAEERFENVLLKAGLLKALNRDSEAVTARTHAMEIGNANQIYFYARSLQTPQANQQPAMELFRVTAKRFPDDWLGHMAAARLASNAGDFATALKEVKIVQAAPALPEAQKANLVNLIKRLENKEDINK